MNIDRENLKRHIDLIKDKDIIKVYDLINHLNMKEEKEYVDKKELYPLSVMKNHIRQQQKNRKITMFMNKIN